MSEIFANGAKLWYDVQGEGDPIACIGGIGLVSNQFDFITPLLAKKAKVLNWDFRGVGKSRPIPKLHYRDYADQAADLLAIMDDAGIEKAHIWGCACSHIGVRFAADYPDRTASLILFPWYSPKKTIKHVFDAGVELSYAFDSLEFWSKIIVDRFSSPNMTPELREWESSKLCENLEPEAFRILWSGMKVSDRSCDLPNIKAPTLLLMGDVGVAGNEANQHAIQAVKSAISAPVETKYINGSGGTFYMIERPEETADALIEWMQSHPIKSSAEAAE
jgi:pimeloyl-ACP methyl ester carboxylesterase